MTKLDSWQEGLQQLHEQGIIAGYALLTGQGQCECSQGLLSDTFSSLARDKASPAAQQFCGVFDSGQQADVFTLLQQKAFVFKQTACDVYAITRRKQLGLCLNNLPFGLLISVFQKPQLPQTVVPKVEAICMSLRS